MGGAFFVAKSCEDLGRVRSNRANDGSSRLRREIIPALLGRDYLFVRNQAGEDLGGGAQHRRFRSSPPNRLTHGLVWHYGVRKGFQMESLALLAGVIILAVYGSGLIAFISSWFKNRVSEIVTYIFSAISVLSGALLGYSLRDGNGFVIALIPVSLGIFSAWNVKRRKQLPAEPS